jgi:uncharacterized protein YdeI (YjbR/CyaY-like superfamily)
VPSRSGLRKVDPIFFRSPAELRRWLQAHHDDTPELWVGLLKKTTGRAGLTYKEALDEALCHGWIDGVRKSVDEDRYLIRFTPRKADSFWSAVNTRRVLELVELKRMAPPGLEAFARRDVGRTREYSYERAAARLEPGEERLFRAGGKAWEFFQAQAPSYRRTVTWWVVSAKQPETRRRRLQKLIGSCAAARRLA